MKVQLEQRKHVRIEMLPLIDIVFLLLVVFIYAMLSMAVHRGVPVELPQSSTAALEQDIIMSVTIQAIEGRSTGVIYLDDEPVEKSELTGLLRRRAGAMRRTGGDEPGVLLFADRSIDYQQLFGVLDEINKAGLTNVSLQADVEQ